MKTLVGIQFKRAGRIYDFDTGGLNFEIGNRVVVETERGLGLGVIVVPPREVEDEDLPNDLKRVIRKANVSDIERQIKNCDRERRAMELCRKFISEQGLDMKLVNVDFFYDASKAVFHFVAAQRVDFRELVKELAQALHTRIEMKQVGVRDETKLVGGLGCCGLQLCCNSFLREFTPVNVKMAKEQNLAMNPTKISGVCGRLMCCLAYEFEVYQEAGKDIPKKGKRVMTHLGPGKVSDVNILKKTLSVELETGTTITVDSDKISRMPPEKQEPKQQEPKQQEPKQEKNKDEARKDRR